MSSVSRYSDEHTLYIISGAARNEDLKQCVYRALARFEKKNKIRYPCEVIPNLIYDREGIPYGFGYLYVSNPQVYHMLLGKNPDGSERTEIIEKSLDFFSVPIEEEIPWFDWADAVEDIEIRRLPPLLTLPSFNYTPDQILLLQKLLQKIRSSEKQHLDPNQFDEKCCTIQLQPGLVKPVQAKYATNILCTRDIPEWLDSADVYRRFRPFIHDKKKKVKKHGKRGIVELSYPIVSINKKNKLCFVEFDPLSRDAQFALIMTTKINFTDKSNPPQSKTLIFTHAFKSNKK